MKEKEILIRLASGIEKQVPDVWDELKNELQKLEGNDNSGNTHHMDKKKKSFRKVSIVSAACFVVIFTLAFTPAFAYMQNEIGKILGNAYHDKGVNSAIEKGIGQVINQSSSSNEITINVDGIISDENKTSVLLSLHSSKDNLGNATINKIEITDERGKNISDGGIMKHSYDSQNNIRRIVYSINSLNGYEGHKINLQINNIRLNSSNHSNNGLMNVDTGIKLDNKDINDLSKSLKDKIPIIDSVIVKKYEVRNGKASVEIDYNIGEDYKDKMVFFKLYYGNGKEVETVNEQVVPIETTQNPDGVSVQLSGNTISYKAVADYKIDNENLLSNGIKIVAQYNERNIGLESVNGNWNFNFKLEKTLASNVTSKVEINKDFSFNNKTYKIKHAVFSPTETRIYIKTGNDSPVLETKDVMIKTDKVVEKCNQYFRDKDGSQVYCFEPIVGNGDIQFHIKGLVSVSLVK